MSKKTETVITADTLRAGCKSLGLSPQPNASMDQMKKLIERELVKSPTYGMYACEECASDITNEVDTCPFCSLVFFPRSPHSVALGSEKDSQPDEIVVTEEDQAEAAKEAKKPAKKKPEKKKADDAPKQESKTSAELRKKEKAELRKKQYAQIKAQMPYTDDDVERMTRVASCMLAKALEIPDPVKFPGGTEALKTEIKKVQRAKYPEADLG